MVFTFAVEMGICAFLVPQIPGKEMMENRMFRMLWLCALALVLVTEAAMAYVWVNSYCKSNGTCVQGHYRSNPDGNFYNN